VAYYQDPPGKLKKAIQNAKRRKPVAPAPPSDPLPCSEPILKHVRTVVSLIEKRRVTRSEMVEMLFRVLRQHSMVRQRRVDQAVDWLNANPP
jgi:hypothetical protein